jgi:hypothetical protein
MGMRALGSLIIAILVGVVAIWLFFHLLVGAIKLVGVLIGIALAVLVFFVAERLIGVGR